MDQIRTLIGDFFGIIRKNHSKIEQLYKFTNLYSLNPNELSNYLTEEQLKISPISNDRFIWFYVPFDKKTECDIFLGLLTSFYKFDETMRTINQKRGPAKVKKHWIVFYYMAVFLSFLYQEGEEDEEFKNTSSSNSFISDTKNRFIIQKSAYKSVFVIRTNFYWMEFYRLHSYLFLIKNPNNVCLIHPIISRLFEYSESLINSGYLKYQVTTDDNVVILSYQKERFKYLSFFKRWFAIYYIIYMLMGWKNKSDLHTLIYKSDRSENFNPFLFMIKPFPDYIESNNNNNNDISTKEEEEKEYFNTIWQKYDTFFHETLTMIIPNLKFVVSSIFEHFEPSIETIGYVKKLSSPSLSSPSLLIPQASTTKTLAIMNNEDHPKEEEYNKKEEKSSYRLELIKLLGSAIFIESVHVIEKKTFVYFYNKFKTSDIHSLINKKDQISFFGNKEEELWLTKEINDCEEKNKRAEIYRYKFSEFWQILQSIKDYNDFIKDYNEDYLIIDSLTKEMKDFIERKNLELEMSIQNFNSSSISSQSSSSQSSSESYNTPYSFLLSDDSISSFDSMKEDNDICTQEEFNQNHKELSKIHNNESTKEKSRQMIMFLLTFGSDNRQTEKENNNDDDEVINRENNLLEEQEEEECFFSKNDYLRLHTSISCLTKLRRRNDAKKNSSSTSKNVHLNSSFSSPIKDINGLSKKRKRIEEKEENEKEAEDDKPRKKSKKRRSSEEIMIDIYKNSWLRKLESTEKLLSHQYNNNATSANFIIPLPPFLKYTDASYFHTVTSENNNLLKITLNMNPFRSNESNNNVTNTLPSPSFKKHNVYKLTSILETLYYLKKNLKQDLTEEHLMENLLYIDNLSSNHSSILLNPVEVLLNLKDSKVIKKTTKKKQKKLIITTETKYFVDDDDTNNVQGKDIVQEVWDLESIMMLKIDYSNETTNKKLELSDSYFSSL